MTMYDLANNFFVRASMEALLNSLWQGIALTALTWAFLRLMPRANAATRYGVWLATLVALVVIPLSGVLLSYADSQGVPAASASRTMTAWSASTSSASTGATGGIINADSPAQARSDSADASKAARNVAVSEVAASDEVAASEVAAGDTVGRLQLPLSRNVELPTGAWLSVVFFGWLLVAGVRTARVLASHRRLRELKRNSVPLDAGHQSRLRQFQSDYPAARRVRLAGSSEINMPVAVGLKDPLIIFPRALVGQLTEEEFDQILLHELAHVQRRDDWTNFAQKLVEAILFFHPAVFWIGRRLNLEREVACDDHVICVTKAGRQYAVCLTRLAELTVMPHKSGLAPGALLSRKHIFSRVEFLLKKGRDTNPRLSKAGLLLPLATLVAAVLPCLLMSPVIALAVRTVSESARPQASAGTDVEAVAAQATGEIVAVRSGSHREVNRVRQDLDGGGGDSRPANVSPGAGQAEATANELRPQNPPAAEADAREGDDAALVINTVSRMSSSADKANALVGLIQREANLVAVPGGFFEAVASIPSSLDKTRVLSTVLSKKPGRSLLIRTLKAAEGIESDHDKSELLVRASRICPDDDAVLSVYLAVVATLHSSSDKERALSALLKRTALSRTILSRARSLALSNIADPQSRQLVIDRIEERLSE